MWTVPNVLVLTSGTGEGETELNAFDNALLDAGVGDLNLVKVSSVFPPGASVLPISSPAIVSALPAGQITPCVLATQVSSVPGATVSSCVAVGVPASVGNPGVIYEHSAPDAKHTVEDATALMIREALQQRNTELKEILSEAATHTTTKIGCAVAVALLLRVDGEE